LGDVACPRAQLLALPRIGLELVAKERDRGDIKAAVARGLDGARHLVRRLDVPADIDLDGVEPGCLGEVGDLLEGTVVEGRSVKADAHLSSPCPARCRTPPWRRRRLCRRAVSSIPREKFRPTGSRRSRSFSRVEGRGRAAGCRGPYACGGCPWPRPAAGPRCR